MFKNIEPKRVLFYFEEISKIPRCSGNEEEISNYLKKFAEDRKLEVIQDELLNIIIKKPATKGYENSKGVILQGHMDMVCEKSTDSNHDFSKDGIKLIEKDGFIHGDNTTLGADNGIAIAMALAILERDDISHPELEVLITISEETTMKGALELSSKILKNRRFINIDSEEEGVLTAGSAGGTTIFGKYKLTYEDSKWEGFNIKFDGLKGGHSGLEIDKNLGNMIKIMSHFLSILKCKTNFRIGKFISGTVDNAIPRSGELKITVENGSDVVLKLVKEEILDIYKELDGDLCIEIEKENIDKVWRKNVGMDILTMIEDMPTGVNTFVKDSTFVESSNNLAFIKEKDDEVYLEISIRSSKNSTRERLVKKVTKILEKNKFIPEIAKSYPGWEYNENSPLRELAKSVYEKMYKKEMETIIIHAGLECGAISSKHPSMDMISIGPNITGAHTPKETMDIESVNRVYEYIVELLAEMK